LYGTGSRKVDAYNNHGLLYIGYGIDADQYWATLEILKGVYRGLLRGRDPDGVSNNNRHVSDASMWPVSARDNFATKARSEATNAGGDRQSMLKGRMTKRARRGTISYATINRPLLPSLS
jgi:hypothetical protein